MPRAPLRTSTAVLAVLLALTPAACGSRPPTMSPPIRTDSLGPQPAASTTPTGLPEPISSAPVGTSPPPTARPPAGAGLRGRTVVVNCPVDRADPPCPGTPVRARVVVLDQTGRTTLATVDTGADGWFTVALPAGSYVIRAAEIGGTIARRPTIRPVTVAAGRWTTITVRLITGLR
ncbi:carboxypeptidase regulatory-like domain-containing protein [Actinoplanes sp. KI2]|uniref:carboxypeptidase-like regulatory domain-containing protein n=1 Tax=Actinoplanes sp. KI2 TaxID=2983315 RepID=UPI0021D57BCB|nr:carboxypeptidase regulatory-like domain-containing protein [Actinoplanes sp. KI2]MCU7728452.1 carboxypeptidase regulatory-like domain-containing protein [Actinoplanes sp. KI2]